jgi:hypothetical protein
MPEEPVTTAAANFRIVIRPLATSAPGTAHIDRDSSAWGNRTPLGLWGKVYDKAK